MEMIMMMRQKMLIMMDDLDELNEDIHNESENHLDEINGQIENGKDENIEEENDQEIED